MIYSPTPLNEAKYVQVSRNYYAVHDEWKQMSEEQRHVELCRCVSKRRSNLIFTGLSACAILGIPRLDPFEMRPHVITDKIKGTDLICWRRGKLDPNSKIVDGMRVASPVRAVCDLAKYDTLESLLVSINHCLCKKLFTKKQILAEIASRKGMRWKNSLLKVLKHATEKCESPLETKAWLAIHRAGFALPKQQENIRSTEKRNALLGRVDMFWEVRKRKIILELDGKIKYINQDVLFDEKNREDSLRENKYDVIRATWADVENGTLIKKLEKLAIPKRRYRKMIILKAAAQIL